MTCFRSSTGAQAMRAQETQIHIENARLGSGLLYTARGVSSGTSVLTGDIGRFHLCSSSSADPKPCCSLSEPPTCLLLLKLIGYQIWDPAGISSRPPHFGLNLSTGRNTSNEQKSQTLFFDMHAQERKKKTQKLICRYYSIPVVLS